MQYTFKTLRVCAADLFAKTVLLPEIDHLIEKGWSVDIAFPEDNATASLINRGYNIILIKSARNIAFISNIKTIIHLLMKTLISKVSNIIQRIILTI